MTWKCPECGETIEYSEEDLAQKGNPVCPKCDSDMEVSKTFSFIIFSGDDRIVHEFDVEAKDEEDADNKAHDELSEFSDGLRLEQQ